MKLYINKLKNSFVYKELLNNYFLVSLVLLFSLLSFINYIWLIALITLCFYIYRNSKIIFIFSTILYILIIGYFLYINNQYEYLNVEEISGVVTEVSYTERYQKLIIKDNRKKYIVYNDTEEIISYGAIVVARGSILPVEENRHQNSFNYKNYLKNNLIYGSLMADNIKVIGKKKKLGIIKYYFEEYIERKFPQESSSFLKAIVIGNMNNLDGEVKDAIVENGILHLFAISGLHIALFIGLINKLLKSLKLKDAKIEIISSVLLIIYLIITNFSPSVLRASLMYYFSLINKKLKLSLSTLDIVSLIFILLLLVNPFYIYNLGFGLSFLAAAVIVIFGDLFKNKHNYLQILYLSIFVNIITLPLVININFKTNLLTPISNVFFIEIVSVFILPMSFLVLIIPTLSYIYNYIIILFNKIIIVFSNVFVINLRLPYLSDIGVFIYYLILLLILKTYSNRKIKYSLCLLLLVVITTFSNKAYIIPRSEVHFIDLDYGEATLIKDSISNCHALIDTGDGKNEEVSSYLKREGIKSLDYVIITHSHLDHIGELDKIIQEFRVKNIVVSIYDDVVKGNNVIKVKAGDKINCGKLQFNILSPIRDYGNLNDNSIVFETKINNINYLFTGDISNVVEYDLLKYGLKIDVLKVAHHGSNTSSDPLFINSLKPTYAVIMSGRVKRFGFPNKEVITNLKNSNVEIYRTDQDYSIIFKKKQKKLKIVTAK